MRSPRCESVLTNAKAHFGRYVAFIGWAFCLVIGCIAIPHIYTAVKVCSPGSAVRMVMTCSGGTMLSLN